MTTNILTSRWINKYTVLLLLYTLFVLVLFVGTLVLAMPANADVPEATHDDVVDVAVKAGSFNTLVAAVKAAGLVETLKVRSRSSPRPTKRLPTGHGAAAPLPGVAADAPQP